MLNPLPYNPPTMSRKIGSMEQCKQQGYPQRQHGLRREGTYLRSCLCPRPISTELGTCGKLFLHWAPMVSSCVCITGLWFLLNHNWKKHQHSPSCIQGPEQQDLFFRAQSTMFFMYNGKSIIQNTQSIIQNTQRQMRKKKQENALLVS